MNRITSMRSMVAILLVAVGGPGCGPASDPEITLAGSVLELIETPSLRIAERVRRVLPGVRLLPPRAEVAYPSESCAGREAPYAIVGTDARNVGFVPMPGSIGTYDLDGIRRLYVGALVRNLCGAHVAYFDLHRPDGRLHGIYAVAFDASGDGIGARRIGDGYAVVIEMAVAGSEIAARHITGRWSVVFRVDDIATPLGAAVFDLR